MQLLPDCEAPAGVKKIAVTAMTDRDVEAALLATTSPAVHMDAIIDDVVARTPDVTEEVGARLPAGFPMRVYDTIVKGLRGATRQLRTASAG
ncbi:MAG TPA: hypothetical protein VGI39_43690 [Polyangiaceae bacterium]